MSVSRNMLQAAAGAAGGGLDVADVFSTDLYTGNGSTQTITNGIDLAGEGGLVWLKRRDSTNDHGLFDTERGATKWIQSNGVDAETTTATSLTSFNSDGFTLGSYFVFNNDPTRTYASWTFRKAPGFFDVVTYTGTGSARTVAHNLGVVPGCIIVKCTDTTGAWYVYHRANTANPETDFLGLNTTNATVDNVVVWNDTAPTDSVFTVGTSSEVNGSGNSFVAYLFGHDPDGLVACGSFVKPASPTGPSVNVGFEPQWLLVKRTDGTQDWFLYDAERGFTGVNGGIYLSPNLSSAEVDSGASITPTSTGFDVVGFVQNATYIYVAIKAET